MVGNWLADNTLLEQQTDYSRLTLEAYRPKQAIAEIIQPLSATTRNNIRLDGVHLTLDGQPIEDRNPLALHTGQTVDVTLVWQGLETMDESYTAFVHLLDENGALAAQHDGIPGNGNRPTTTWIPGEQVLDTHTLIVSEGYSGNGRLIAGLYGTETLEREQFDTGDDFVLITEISSAQ